MIVSLVAIISGVSGVIIGLSSLRSAQLGSINDYFTSGDTKEFKHARGILYTYALQYSNNGISVFNKDFKLQHHDIDKKPIVLYKDDVISTISYISNFFHQWGLLTKHRYLPLWVFQSSSGISVYRLYNASREVIDTYRKTSNPFYGEYFEWLYLKVYKTYKDEIHSYLELNKEKINTKSDRNTISALIIIKETIKLGVKFISVCYIFIHKKRIKTHLFFVLLSMS